MARNRPLAERVEVADNPEARCPCVLLLDTSGSMKGRKLEGLTAGLHTLRSSLIQDPTTARRIEVAVVAFDTRVRVLQRFAAPDDFQIPALTASGETHMAEAVRRASQLVRERKEFYKREGLAFYRPWVFMITDGKPEGETEEAVAAAAARIRADERAKRLAFFAVGVDGADMSVLATIAQRPPLPLRDLAFDDLFQWLSASLQSVSRSQPGEVVKLPQMTWLHHVVAFMNSHKNTIENLSGVLRLAAKVATGV